MTTRNLHQLDFKTPRRRNWGDRERSLINGKMTTTKMNLIHKNTSYLSLYLLQRVCRLDGHRNLPLNRESSRNTPRRRNTGLLKKKQWWMARWWLRRWISNTHKHVLPFLVLTTKGVSTWWSSNTSSESSIVSCLVDGGFVSSSSGTVDDGSSASSLWLTVASSSSSGGGNGLASSIIGVAAVITIEAAHRPKSLLSWCSSWSTSCESYGFHGNIMAISAMTNYFMFGVQFGFVNQDSFLSKLVLSLIKLNDLGSL